MRPIVFILIQIINLYIYLLIASAILSWLIAFNVVNTRNQFVGAVWEFLYRITEPVLGPIRRRLPAIRECPVTRPCNRARRSESTSSRSKRRERSPGH